MSERPDYALERGEICTSRGLVRNKGSWLGGLLLAAGLVGLATVPSEIKGFAALAMGVGFVVYIYAQWDNISGIRDRDFLKSLED